MSVLNTVDLLAKRKQRPDGSSLAREGGGRDRPPQEGASLPCRETPPHALEPPFRQGLTVLTETSVVPRTVLGLEGRLHVEERTFLIVAVP